MSKSVSQIPLNLGFRYRIPCRKTTKKWSEKFTLSADYQLPHFGKFEVQNNFADWRAAWSDQGLFFHIIISGKQQSLWCRQTAILESDGVQVWVDTRDTHNVHRATRFCHWFIALPQGGGSTHTKPLASMLKINRAREDSPSMGSKQLKMSTKKKADGYELKLFIPAASLNGWNLEDHRNLGFSIAVVDRELGWQTLAAGPELPIMEDPSLWHTLSLID